jgi:hypothetical protein
MAMKSSATPLALAAGIAAFGAGQAAGETIAPGLWKVTVTTQIPGAPPRPTSHTSCLTPEQVKDPVAQFARVDTSMPNGCKRSGGINGKVLTWTMECTGAHPMSGKGTITLQDARHYAGTVTSSATINGRPFEMSMHMEGERVGECGK